MAELLCDQPLLTIREAADLCSVSDKTIRRRINAQELRAIKLGGQWRIAPSDLDAFLRSRRT